jgi:hypothetical protein
MVGHHRVQCGSAALFGCADGRVSFAERTTNVDRQLLQAPISLLSAAHATPFSTKLMHPYDVLRPVGGQHFERPHERYLSPALAVHLSNKLADVGRRAEAVAPIEEAVSIYRRLVVAAPDAYLLDLARSFTTSH